MDAETCFDGSIHGLRTYLNYDGSVLDLLMSLTDVQRQQLAMQKPSGATNLLDRRRTRFMLPLSSMEK